MMGIDPLVAYLVVGLLVAAYMGSDGPVEFILFVGSALLWPLALAARFTFQLSDRTGIFIRTRGPLTTYEEPHGEWHEHRKGPFAAGAWRREGLLGRWVVVGKPNGRGLLIGRTTKVAA